VTFTEVITVPSIIGICYLVGFICKSFNVKKLDNFIPAICGVLGLVLGVVMYLTIPNYIPADNWAEAVLVGIASGFASTGINQVFKQFKKLFSGGE